MFSITKSLIFTITLFLSIFNTFCQSATQLKLDEMSNPLGFENLKPNFSWEIKPNGKSTKQTAYQIIVSSTEDNLKKDLGDIWNSNKTKGTASTKIEFKGKVLESRKKYFWKVKIWNEKAKPSTWSETGNWEMGLLNMTDWTATWIGKLGTEGKPAKAIDLQKEFNLAKRAIKARVYVTGMGAYNIIFNGKKVGSNLLQPNWVNYNSNLEYQIYVLDPELLSVGANFISATIGNGFIFNETGNSAGMRYSAGLNRLKFQMELTFYDGSIQTIGTDKTWEVRLAPIIESNMYSGEKYDATLEYSKDWQKADNLDDKPNTITNFDLDKKPESDKNTEFFCKNLPLKVNQSILNQSFSEFKPISFSEVKKGRFVYDFGNNLKGFIHLFVEGKDSKEVEIKFGEKLDNKGLVDQSSYGTIRPKDVYMLKGYGIEEWEPRFAIHNFRYVEVSGFPGKAKITSVVAKIVNQN
jgi:alpha-L-rhamnosidase